MAKTPFAGIGKKPRAPKSEQEFIEGAKVDGTQAVEPKAPKLDKNERRGASYKDSETGEKVELTGAKIQVAVNGWELEKIKQGAAKKGLTIASYLRTIGISMAGR